MYGAISGPQQEEFNVIKFNRKGKGKEKILVIDGFYIFNRKIEKDKEESKQGGTAN